MRLLDRAPVCMGGEAFLTYRVFDSCFSLESSGWLHGCLPGSRSGRPCTHASIPVPRGGAWFASHPWRPDQTWPLLSAVRGSHGSRPRRQPSSPALSPRHVTAHYATLPWPDLPFPTLPACPCTMPILLCVSLTWPISLSLCYCRVAILHCTMQPGRAITTPASCSWRRGLTSQLETWLAMLRLKIYTAHACHPVHIHTSPRPPVTSHSHICYHT
jgi:hypothetical protein